MGNACATSQKSRRLTITTPSGHTDDRSVTISGVLADATGAPVLGREVEIDEAGVSLGSASVAADGHWSADILLPDLGPNTLVARTIGGAAATSAPVVLTLDTVISPPHGGPATGEVTRLSLPAHGAEVSGAGAATTFVFRAHPGHAVIDGFDLSGPGADNLSLPQARFATLVDVLHHTSMVGNDAVIHLSPRDSITLTGVAKSALRDDRTVLSLHP